MKVATVLRPWKCVVKKGEFKVGDLCVYVEIDSCVNKLLLKPFEFLKEKGQIGFGFYHIKTMKLRGVFSQGLIPYLIVNFKQVKKKTNKDMIELLY